MPFWSYFLLWLIPLVAGIAVLFVGNTLSSWRSTLLSFSGSFLFGITVVHLIPETFHGHAHNLGMLVFLGFFIQIVLEQASKGIEHGHVHANDSGPPLEAVPMIIGLFLHAFLEGIPLGYSYQLEGTNQFFLTALIFHKVPVAIALVLVMIHYQITKPILITILTLFTVMSPLGGIIFGSLKNGYAAEWQTQIMAIVIGTFFHVSTTILFETSSKSHKFSPGKWVAILFGGGLALLTQILH